MKVYLRYFEQLFPWKLYWNIQCQLSHNGVTRLERKKTYKVNVNNSCKTRFISNLTLLNIKWGVWPKYQYLQHALHHLSQQWQSLGLHTHVHFSTQDLSIFSLDFLKMSAMSTHKIKINWYFPAFFPPTHLCLAFGFGKTRELRYCHLVVYRKAVATLETPPDTASLFLTLAFTAQFIM